MSANVPTTEPLRFQAGDTLRFDKSLFDYSGSLGWSLTYTLVSGNLPVQTFNTISTTSTFSVNVASAVTALWQPGTYLMTGTVSNGADRFTIYQAEIIITPNLEALAPGTNFDYRSYAAKTLALIEGIITGAVQRREISYSANGRTLTAKTDKELFDARDYFKSCVNQENAFGKNRKILTRFVKVK